MNADTIRPQEDRIPDAVRTLFQDRRFQAAWRTASLATQNDRMAAVEGVFRLLARNGLTFEDITTTLLAPIPHVIKISSAFEGMFDVKPANAVRRPDAQTAARPAHDHRPEGGTGRPADFDGPKRVPDRISGTIQILGEHDISSGTMLQFVVHDGGDVHGPIVCFAGSNIAALKNAVDEDARVTMNIRQANGPGRHPTATSVRFL